MREVMCGTSWHHLCRHRLHAIFSVTLHLGKGAGNFINAVTVVTTVAPSPANVFLLSMMLSEPTAFLLAE